MGGNQLFLLSVRISLYNLEGLQDFITGMPKDQLITEI